MDIFSLNPSIINQGRYLIVNMYDHLQSTLRAFSPGLFIIHNGNNDQPLNKASNKIAEEILNLAKSVKKTSSNIVISSIVTREDDCKTKVDKVNKMLEEICGKKGIPLIRNDNINPKRRLNRSRLHLNDTGVTVLVRNVRTFLTNFESKIDQGIHNDNSSPSSNGAEAFLNDIKKIKQQRVKNANNTIICYLIIGYINSSKQIYFC